MVNQLIFLHCTLSTVELDFGGLLLFEALHSNVLVLSTFFLLQCILMEAASVQRLLVMSLEPKYQVKVAAGTAFLFTIYVSGLSLGIMDTLWTSTVLIVKVFFNLTYVVSYIRHSFKQVVL